MYSNVPENSISGELTSSFGKGTELEFKTNGCSFSGQINLDVVYKANIDEHYGARTVDHMFVVTLEADPGAAYQNAIK